MAKPSKKPKRPEEPKRSKQFVPGKVRMTKKPGEFLVYRGRKTEKTVTLDFGRAVNYCVVKLNTASLPHHFLSKGKRRRFDWINAWAILDRKTGRYVNIVRGGYIAYFPAGRPGLTYHAWDKMPGAARPGLRPAKPTRVRAGLHKGKLQWQFYSGDPGIGSP